MLYHASVHFARGKRKKLARRHVRAELGLAVGDEADVFGNAQPLFVYRLQRAAEQLDNAANHGLRAQRRDHGRNIQVEDDRALLDPAEICKTSNSCHANAFTPHNIPATFFFQKSSFGLDKLKLA